MASVDRLVIQATRRDNLSEPDFEVFVGADAGRRLAELFDRYKSGDVASVVIRQKEAQVLPESGG